MEILANLLSGFEVAFSWQSLLWCLAGVSLGTLVGVLPGLGPMASISMLLPFSFYIDNPINSIIFLSGIYYGTQYGGSTTSILLNLPGEASSAVTAVEGHKLSQQGRAGSALTIAAIGSFVAGTFATLLVALIAKPLSELAMLFGPAEYAALMFFGLIAAISLTNGSMIKGIGMVLIGMLIGLIGLDINTGIARFTFGSMNLQEGISFAIIAMAVFGLAELLFNLLGKDQSFSQTLKFKDLYPSKEELKKSVGPISRGSILGSVMGIIPGAGPIISSFSSYALEKYISKDKGQFGKGAIEGVAGPESANNAAAQTSFIPMLSLGIPTTPVMALLVAALMMYNIQPGPQIITGNSTLFWALIASMWIGNLFLLLLNIPLVGIWVKVLSVPRKILYPLIIIVCVVGAYSINNDWFFVWLLVPLALLGLIFKLLDCEPAPLALGFVLGPMFEDHLRRALIISRGDWLTFVDKPISLTFLILTVLLLMIPPIMTYIKRFRRYEI